MGGFFKRLFGKKKKRNKRYGKKITNAVKNPTDLRARADAAGAMVTARRDII